MKRIKKSGLLKVDTYGYNCTGKGKTFIDRVEGSVHSLPSSQMTRRDSVSESSDNDYR
jgi:hypothetical protein